MRCCRFPTQSRKVQVAFDPTVPEGPKTATLETRTDDTDEPVVEVMLTGTTLGPAAPGFARLPSRKRNIRHSVGDLRPDGRRTGLERVGGGR